MKKRIRPSFRQLSINLAVSALILLPLSLYGGAQDQPRVVFDVSGGFSPLVGDISSRLNNGWHYRLSGGYDFSRYFSTNLEFMYNGYGVSRRVLNEAQVPSGDSHLWALTLNPKLRLHGSSHFSPYVVGGVGYYRRVVNFTRPVLVPTLVLDPFFGGFLNTVTVVDQVLGTIQRSGVGGSLGAGFEVGLGSSGVKFFTEARYHYADTGAIPTRMVPVSFGISFPVSRLWGEQH